MSKLVSIIVPCYNVEHCLHRLMDSIINQTYRPIEVIFVNDGSTDKTQLLIESYNSKFKDADIACKILSQENKGLGGAINAGLKAFSGDYLCWPDADDYLEPTSVEDRINCLESNSECAVVSSDAYCRDYNQLWTYKWKVSDPFKYNEDPYQFEHLLNGESIFCAGSHMVRTKMFLGVNPDREIYPARRGQNWQMLLPLYYKYKRVYLDKPLYNYVMYQKSMSYDNQDIDSILMRYKEHEEILIETLNRIEKYQKTDLHKYYLFVYDKYAKLRMETYIRFGEKELFWNEYAKKKLEVGIDIDDRIAGIRIKNQLWNWSIKICAKLIRRDAPPAPQKAINKLRISQ